MTAPSGPESATTSPVARAGAAPSGTSPSGGPRPQISSADPDWTDQVTDLIVDSVDKVRARTTGPILQGAKGAVYAIVAMVLTLPVMVLGLIGVVRGLNYVIPGDVWITYAVLGIIFLLAGVLLWSRRKPVA